MKVSTLGYAILGLVAAERLSGYDVKRLMGDPVGFFWQASHSQIYPELAKLEESGLISHVEIAQSGKPDKKVYEITPSGLEAVREWVVIPAKKGSTRDETTLKAYHSWLGDPAQMAGIFRAQAERREEQITHYGEVEAWMRREWGEDMTDWKPRQFAGYAALRRGIGFEREYAEWCRWIADNLERRESDTRRNT